MSKRSPLPLDLAVGPLKFPNMANVWDMIPDSDHKDLELVENDLKIKVLKSVVLNLKPKVDVSISLCGCNPEVRFTSGKASFFMTGEEFKQMSHVDGRSFRHVRIESLIDKGEVLGFFLMRYERLSSGEEQGPYLSFDLNTNAAKKLKEKLGELSSHVEDIVASEEAIMVMFRCVVDAYKTQYELANYGRPMAEYFQELSRIVEVYVPSAVIVNSFQNKMRGRRLVSKFDHYSLLSSVLAQKELLFQLVWVHSY